MNALGSSNYEELPDSSSGGGTAGGGTPSYGSQGTTYGNSTHAKEVNSTELDLDDLANGSSSSRSPKVCQRRSNVLLFIYLPFYSIYIACAALVFMQTEGSIEESLRIDLRETRAVFLDTHQCVSDGALEDLIREVLSASSHGVSALNNSAGESNWSFGQSFFFSFTIITTIGYGQVHPLSEGGKLFCIAYAIFGIPMTFILLTALVERYMLPSYSFLSWLSRRLEQCWQPLSIKVLHLGVVGVLSFVLFLLFPALILAELEPGWGIFDAVYYCFISLTTIGLGDYIPGDSPEQLLRPLYKIAVTIYLLLGLSVLMLLLRLYSEIPQLNIGSFLLQERDMQHNTETVRLVPPKHRDTLSAS